MARLVTLVISLMTRLVTCVTCLVTSLLMLTSPNGLTSHVTRLVVLQCRGMCYLERDRASTGERCPERLSNSKDVSLTQRVLMTPVLRLIMNDGFRFDFSIACSEFFRVSWVNRW